MKHTIYKIHSDSCDYVYVGSTRSFTSRKAQHKMCCNKETNAQHNLKVYATIRANGGWDSFKMVPIEEFECNTIQQAHIREQHWIDALQSNMNSRGSIFNKEKNEHYNRNYNDTHKEQQKDWRDANREKINAYQREYRKKRKEASQITN